MKTTPAAAALLAALALAPQAATAEDTTTFIFADVGTTYTGFVFSGDPRIGREVVLTRIFLTVHVSPGASAADFDTDITFPITPHPGNSAALGITGAGLNWSGSGTFIHMVETTMFNGTFIQTLYGAATAPMDALIDESSRIEMVFAPIPAPASAAALALGALSTARRRRRR